MIKESFDVIFKDKEWVKKTAIGALFSIIPILQIFSIGYIEKFLHSILKEGNRELPGWTDWGSLFVKGFLWLVISIIYLFVPLLLLGAILPIFKFFITPLSILRALNPLGISGFSLGSVLLLIIFFFLPMALMSYSDTESIGAAFHFKEIWDKIEKNMTTYISAYAIVVVVGIIGFLIMLFVSSIPLVGSLVAWYIAAWIWFIIYLLGFSIFAETYK